MAKRRLRETWREAVARRAAETGGTEAVLAEYDRLAGEGGEANAAFRSLERHGMLWPLPDSPAFRPTTAPVPSADAAPASPGRR